MVNAILLAAAVVAILAFLWGVTRRLWIMWKKHCRHKRMEQQEIIKEIVIQVLAEKNHPVP